MIDITKYAHADRYGYYQIGDVRTYCKTDLMSLHYRLPRPWQWKYNDEFFGTYDWTHEPAEDLKELYRRRALQLRQDYDYLVLNYSGGYDSSNVLYAFLDNDIPLDEICVHYSRYDRISNQYKELTNYTYAKLEYLKSTHPNLKIRMIDYSDQFFTWDQQIHDMGHAGSLLDMFGTMLSINRLVVDNFHNSIDDWREIIQRGKKFAWIQGIDKPMIRYLDGDWIFNFHDGFIQARMSPLRQLQDHGDIGNYEFFYWSPTHTCAQIIIKQCHLLKKRFGAQAAKDFSKIPGSKPFKSGYGWEIDIMSPEFVKVIYPRCFLYDEQYFTLKNPKHIFGNRDQWFFESNHDKAKLHKDMYLSTNSKSYHYMRSWFSNGQNIFDGLTNCISPNYKF